MKRIILAGGTGFLGEALAQHFFPGKLLAGFIRYRREAQLGMRGCLLHSRLNL